MNKNTYHIFFNNLANPLKIKIITSLKEKKQSVTELTKSLNEEQSKISHALSSLKHCHIVDLENKGKKRIYFCRSSLITLIASFNLPFSS